MNKSTRVQIVYALVASKNDYFLEEIWASIYSLKLYEPKREVRVCCDEATSRYIYGFPNFISLVNEVITVPIPLMCNTPKLISRELKTKTRECVRGDFIFVDTDTIFCGNLSELDELVCDIGAVLEYHLPLSASPFKYHVYKNMQDLYDVDVEGCNCWFNSGMLFVKDNDLTRKFYKEWNRNWQYSAFKKNMSQDEPALMKTNIDFGFIITELSGIYNCQPSMSVRFLHEAKIIHFLHMYFPADQSFNPFMDKSFYRQIRDEGGVTARISEKIRNVKSSYASPTCVVGDDVMFFLTSPVASIFCKIYKDGGPASFLMIKMSTWLDKLHKLTRRNK